MTIFLPSAMVKEVEKIRKLENRTRSELIREALRRYFSNRFPLVSASPSELAAVRRGRAEIKAGKYVTWDQLLHGLDSANRKRRGKKP